MRSLFAVADQSRLFLRDAAVGIPYLVLHLIGLKQICLTDQGGKGNGQIRIKRLKLLL